MGSLFAELLLKAPTPLDEYTVAPRAKRVRVKKVTNYGRCKELVKARLFELDESVSASAVASTTGMHSDTVRRMFKELEKEGMAICTDPSVQGHRRSFSLWKAVRPGGK